MYDVSTHSPQQMRGAIFEVVECRTFNATFTGSVSAITHGPVQLFVHKTPEWYPALAPQAVSHPSPGELPMRGHQNLDEH